MTADQLLRILWKRRASLVLTLVVTLLAAAAVTFSLPKVYSTNAFLWVTPTDRAGSDFEATQLSQVLSRSYAELLQTDAVARAVADRLPFDLSPNEVRGAVEVQPVTQSQLLQIRAEGSTPERARTIANNYADVFIERAGQLDDQGVTASRVSLAEAASAPGSPSRPKPRLYLVVGAVLALLAGTGVALLRERLDQRLHVGASTTEVLGLPVIGRIPRVPPAKLALMGRDGTSDPRVRAIDDSFRLVLTNLSFLHQGGEPATVAVVSPSQGEGKSTCCIQLARVAMELGRRVLVVDADLRRPSLSRELGLAQEGTAAGLSSFLVKPRPIKGIEVEVPGSPLRAVPSGPTPPNPTALLGSPPMSEFDQRARERFDIVVYDTPPVSTGADASLIAERAEAVLLVVDRGRTRRTAAVRALDQLRRARANVSGVVVNRFSEPVAAGYYHGAGDGRLRRRGSEAEPGSGDEMRALRSG
jgi:succinoglycan biosynthesis transport protein ExoP